MELRRLFSGRLPATFRANALAEAVARARAESRPLLDLSVSNPTVVGLMYPPELVSALSEPSGVRYAPSPLGLESARVAIAADCGRHGAPPDPDRIVLTASTSEAYSFLFKLLCDPGDEVLVPAPSYPLFEHLTAMDSVVARAYRLDYHGLWWIDTGSLRERFGSRTKAVLVVAPNNPTGSLVRASQWADLRAWCAAHRLALICDEVFGEYLLDPADDGVQHLWSHGGGDEGPLMFVLSGLSKLVGLPQHKLAWTIVDGPAALVDEARRGLELICDTYLSVSTAVQLATPRLLSDGTAIRAAIRARLDANWGALRARAGDSPSCDVLRAEGGWSAVLRIPALRSEEEFVVELVERDQVLVHPGFFFDFDREAFVVLSLLPEPAIFTEGIDRVFRRAESPAAMS